MKRIIFKGLCLVALCILFFTTGTSCNSLSKTCRVVKRQYAQSWEAINEFSLREAPREEEQQTRVREEQCRAFRFLADKWNANEANHREVIEMALLRWGWLPGDAFPNTGEVVDYKMVYMEFLQKVPTSQGDEK